jgi:hypothetical protein
MIIDDKTTGGRNKYMKIYIIFAVLFAMLIGTSLAQNATTGDVNAFKQALEKDGFTVQKGGLGYYDWNILYEKGLIPSPYAANPATKYLTYYVPPALGHKVPELFSKIASVFGKSANLSPYWNLGPDEAVIFIGRTPPECKYFAYDHYIIDRTYGNETRWISADLPDPINNLVINTEGTPNGLPGNPFNQTTVIIATADRGINQHIRDAAISAGYSGDVINTQIFPSAMLNMGSENNSDTFAIYIRPSLFKDERAGNNYLNNTPATIFRITPNESTKLDPYNYPEMRVRGTGKTEFDLTDNLNKLRQAILTKYSGLNATELPVSQAVPVGIDAIQRGIDAIVPTNDACYLWTVNRTPSSPTPPFFTPLQSYPFLRDSGVTLGNDTNDFIIVYGVNHAATGKATYENFVIDGADILNSVGPINDADFNGTANEYLPDNPNAKYLYVYKIARNCNGDPHCFEVPYGPGVYGIYPNQPVVIFWRIYLEKSTKTGPSYSEIVYDRAIKFSPKK